MYDKVQMYKVTIDVDDPDSEPESEEEEKLQHDRLKVGNVFEYLDGSRRGKIKRHKKREVGADGEDLNVHDRKGKTEVDTD